MVQDFLPTIASSGVLVKTIGNATSSIDFVFAMNVRESETFPPLLMPIDVACVEEKMSSFRSKELLLRLKKKSTHIILFQHCRLQVFRQSASARAEIPQRLRSHASGKRSTSPIRSLWVADRRYEDCDQLQLLGSHAKRWRNLCATERHRTPALDGIHGRRSGRIVHLNTHAGQLRRKWSVMVLYCVQLG